MSLRETGLQLCFGTGVGDWMGLRCTWEAETSFQLSGKSVKSWHDRKIGYVTEQGAQSVTFLSHSSRPV